MKAELNVVAEHAKDTVMEEALDKAIKLVDGLLSSTVNTYWEVGDILSQLDKQYGDSVVKEFGVKLANKLGRTEAYSEATLYRALQFRRKYSVDQKEKLINARVSWSQIVKVLTEPMEVIDQCIKRLEAQEIDPQKFSDAVKEMRESSAVSDGGMSAVTGGVAGLEDSEDDPPVSDNEKPMAAGKDQIRSIKKQLGKIGDNLQLLIDVMGDIVLVTDQISKLDEKAMDQLAEDIQTVKGRLLELSKAGSAAKKGLDRFVIG